MTGRYDGGKLQGFCPMGCGQTLERVAGGEIRCTAELCGKPDAAQRILMDPEAEHIVTITDCGRNGGVTFSLRHPLRERLDGDLEACALHAFLSRQLHTGALHSRATVEGTRWRIRKDTMRPPGARSYNWESVHMPTVGEVGDGG